MQKIIQESLLQLYNTKQFLEKKIVLWGIGRETEEIIDWLLDRNIKIDCIVDNFKWTFLKEYHGISVKPAIYLQMHNEKRVILLAVNFSEAIIAQIEAYGIRDVYNLFDILSEYKYIKPDISYDFTDRSRGKNILCYILAGYQEILWDNVFERISHAVNDCIDYCIISSGINSVRLAEIAKKNEWSYLATNQNQAGYIQNLVVDLHPAADYIFKLDEDIFIGKKFFQSMMDTFHEIEKKGEYRINFLVPVIPLNCAGFMSFLKRIDKLDVFEELFGKCYKSRFSVVFSLTEAAKYIWEQCIPLDQVINDFDGRLEYDVLNSYFNIGCILYTRERWLMMGKWPEQNGTGMGDDEKHIIQDGSEKDFSIYEAKHVLVGHLGFGPQKKVMEKFFVDNSKAFEINFKKGAL